MGHMTWHVTYDMWPVTVGGRWTFYQKFSSQAVTAWEWRFVEYLEEKAALINLWVTKVFIEQPRLHRVWKITMMDFQPQELELEELQTVSGTSFKTELWGV